MPGAIVRSGLDTSRTDGYRRRIISDRVAVSDPSATITSRGPV